MLLAHHQNKHSTNTGDNNSGADSKIKPEKGMERQSGKTSSSATVLQLRLLEDPKECFFFLPHSLLWETFHHDRPMLKQRSLSCPSVAECHLCFTTFAVSSSTPASQSMTFEPGHLSHWSKYIEMIHCAQCSRV